ncbi:MAG: LysR family transcriptional regulator [Sphingorhabdus sp.]
MLDTKLLHAFVTVADAGSFTAAADQLNSTQSTVSQQIGRLEDVLGQSLFDRSARPVKLSPAGERLVGHARRILALQTEAQALLADPSGSRTIRVGLPDDMVTSNMSRAFAQFTARHPEIRLDVTTGLSRELSRRFRHGEFDVAIIKEPEPQADARASFTEPLAWFEATHRQSPLHHPIPLVSFPPGGMYRDDMIETIEREGLRWYLAFCGNSLASVLHAVEAGLGLSVLPVSAVGKHQLKRFSILGEVRPLALSIYAWEQDASTAELLHAIIHILSAERV